MKKLLCSLIMGIALISGVFAQEAKSAEKSGGFDYHNLRLEAAVPLTFIGIGFDIRCAYEFPINDDWSWNLGVDTNFSAYILGGNISILGFGSIWWKSIYLTYGLGLGINTEFGSLGFIPLDIRFGWQPNFTSLEKSGLSFKIEAGLFGMWAATGIAVDIDKGSLSANDMGFIAPFGISLGAAYRF